MKDDIVLNFLSKSVVCAPPGMPLREITKIMRTKRVSCVIIEQAKSPIGIITERDLVRLLDESFDDPLVKELKASDWMSSPPVTVRGETSVYDALVLTLTQKIRHLPVVDGNDKLVGIITYSDLAQKHFKLIEKHVAQIDRSKKVSLVNAKLLEMSFEDKLMGIGNRRSMEVDLQYTHSAAQRYRRSYSVLFVDIDYFKKFNDTYGHSEGDAALQLVGSILKSAIRKSDRIYRYGGEEVVLLLPETEYKGAIIIADKLVKSIAAKEIPHSESPFHCLTISCGIGCLFLEGIEKELSWEDIIHQADETLYKAKENGRNQVGSPLP